MTDQDIHQGIDSELDPVRDRMIAALYGELPPEEEEEFLTRLASDPALRAEWDELQQARGFLQEADATEPDPGFVFELPAAARGGAAPHGVRERLRAWRLGLLMRPAAGFAFAAAAALILMIAGLRIDRVQGGLALHFGPASPATPALVQSQSASDGAVQLAAGQGGQIAGIEPALRSGDSNLDLNAPVTRAEMAAFAQELVSATETQFQKQEDRVLGQTVYLLRDYHRAAEEVRQHDRREITSEMNRALLALLQAGAWDGERLELPRERADGDSAPARAPGTQTEEGVRHE